MKNENQSNQVKQAAFIQEYFEKLPAWDGTDHIEKLSCYLIPTKLMERIDEKQRINKYLKMMLVKMIANTFVTNINKHCLTLVGEKGIGKSDFLNWLNPPGLPFVISNNIDATNHSLLHLTQNFIYRIINLSQLPAENVISMNDQLVRGQLLVENILSEKVTSEKRICNIVASASNMNFFDRECLLKRCVCFFLKEVDPDYKNKIDILKVWSQAYSLYNSSDYSNKMNEKDRMLNKLYNSALYAVSIEKRYKEIYPDAELFS